MGKKNKAKDTEEQALAKRLAKALGLKVLEITDPRADDEEDRTWIFFSPERVGKGGSERDGYWTDAIHPIFGTDADYGLVDENWFGNWDDSESRPVPIPEWLTERTTLEEIDLRLTAMGF